MPRHRSHVLTARRCGVRLPLRAGHRPLVLALALALAHAFALTPVLAQPAGAQAILGTAGLNQQGNRLVVTTTNGPGAAASAINWQSFSVPAGTATWFAQPSAASTSINRVLGPDPSLIYGSLGSNGRLVLVNPAGITVGAGAVVDTAGFVASTLRMTDADALAGRLRFGNGDASSLLKVDGQVLARSGDVVLIGRQVEVGAQAAVSSPQGATVLAAGQQAELTGRGLEGIVFTVQAPADRAVNLGRLSGDAVGIFAGTLRHSGLAQANAVSLEGGRIVLRAADTVLVSGQAQAQKAGGAGGGIDVLGQQVGLQSGAVLETSNTGSGGQIRVGGGYQGQDAGVPNARLTTVEPGVTLRADATLRGDGGRIVVWSDDTTRSAGSFSVRGGPQGGDGGLVETSGRRFLDVTGTEVAAGAPRGQRGTWLLDPDDLVVIHSESPVRPVSGDALFVPAGDGSLSTVRDSQINSVLSGRDGASVILRTGTVSSTPAPVGSGDIRLRTGVVLGRQNAGGATLTLDAWRDIVFENQGPGSTVQIQTSALGTVDDKASLVVNLRPGAGGSGQVRIASGVELDVGGAGSATALNVVGTGQMTVPAGGALNLLPNTAMTAVRVDNAGTIALQTASMTVTAAPSPDMGVVNNQGVVQLDKASSLSASTLNVGTSATLTAAGQSSLVVGSLVNQGSVSLYDSTLTVDSLRLSQSTPDGTSTPASFQAWGSSSATVLRGLSIGKNTSMGIWGSTALDVTQVEGDLVLPSTVSVSTDGSVALRATAGNVQLGTDLRAGSLLVQASGDLGADGRNLFTTQDGQTLTLSAGGWVTFGSLGTTGGTVTITGAQGIAGGAIDSSSYGWTGASGVGDISLSSKGGGITVGALKATGDGSFGPRDGGTVRIVSAGATRIASIDVRGSGPGEGGGAGGAGGRVGIASTGDVTLDNDILATGGSGAYGTAGAGGEVRITSTAGGVRVHGVDVSGNDAYGEGAAASDGGLVRITAAQTVQADSLVADGGGISVTPGGAGGQVLVAGASGVQVGSASAQGGQSGFPPGGGGLVSLASSAGNVVVTSSARAGSVQLQAAGDVLATDATLASPTLGGQVQVSAGGQITFNAISTNGGAVTLTAGGDITGRWVSTELGDGAGQRAGSVSMASTGGSVSLDTLDADGSVIDGVSKGAGSLTITAAKDVQAGTLWLLGADNATADGGQGGSAQLSAGRTLTLTGAVYARGGSTQGGTGGAGGTVSLNAGSGTLTVTDIGVQGGDGSVSGTGGRIMLTSGGGIVASSTLDASGGTAADGGLVSLRASGTVTAGILHAGAGVTGPGGRGGQILVKGDGGLTVDEADASSAWYTSRTNVGGLVSLGSSAGTVQINRSVRAGAIRVQAAQAVQAGGASLASPDVDGLVTVTAGTTADVRSITTQGGDVAVSAAGNVHVGTVTTELAGLQADHAGKATLSSTGGDVLLDQAQMEGGTGADATTGAGALTVTAAGSVVVGTLSLSGASGKAFAGGAGGTVLLSAGGNLTATGSIQVRGGSGTTGGAGGTVSLQAGSGTVTLLDIEAWGGGGGAGAPGGSILVDAGAAVLANGRLSVGGSAAGAGGSIRLSSPGTVSAADLWAGGGSSEGGPIGAGGQIVLSGAAGVTLGNAAAPGVRTAPDTTSGLVSLVSSSGSVTLLGTARAGTVQLQAAQDILADGPQASIVSDDPAGQVLLAADRAIQFNSISSRGGSVGVRAAADVTGVGISNRPWASSEVRPGSVVVESTGGTVSITSLDASGNGPVAGGQIQVTAAQGMTLGTVTASGDSSYSGGNGSDGGSVTLQSGQDLHVKGSLSASGGYGITGGAGGTVQASAKAGSVEVAGVDVSGSGNASGGAGGQIRLLAATQVRAPGRIRADGGPGAAGGSVTLDADGTVSAGEVRAVGGDPSSAAGPGTGGEVRIAGAGGVTADTVDAGGAPYSDPRGTGGLVSLSSAAGDVQLTGSARAGTVRMDAGGNLLVSAGAQLISPDVGGVVDLSSSHALQFGTISSNGGTVTVLAAGDVSGQSVSARPWEAGGPGSISVRSTGGRLDLGSLDASGGTFGITTAPGGQVSLQAATGVAVGSVDVGGAANTAGGLGGTGGRIQITAGTDLDVSGSLNAAGGYGSSAAGGAAGSITLLASGGNLTVADLSVQGGSGTSGAAGGSIRLGASGNVQSKGVLDARGGTASNGGTIQITAGGTVRTSTLWAGGQNGSVGGAGGEILVSGASDLDIGYTDASGAAYSTPVGTGGLISLVSSGGNVRLNSTVSAGTVRVRAGGDLVATDTSSVSSPDIGGVVDLAADGQLRFNTIDSNGGTVRVRAGGDILGNGIGAWVRQATVAGAGTIAVDSTGGHVTLGSLSAFGRQIADRVGKAGEITVTAAQSLTLDTADVSGADNGNGGDGSSGGRLQLSAGTSLTIRGGLYARGGYGSSDGVGAGGGSIRLHAGTGDIRAQGVNAWGGTGASGGAGGQILADAGGDIVAAAPLYAWGGTGAQGGLIQLSAGGMVIASGLNAAGGFSSAGQGGAGGQVLVSGDAGLHIESVDAGGNPYSAAAGTGGLASLTASGGDITVTGTVNAGTVRVRAGRDLLAGTTGNFSSGDATGLIDLSAAGGLQFGSIDSNGGTVRLLAANAVQGGSINAQLRTDTADRSGSITATSSGGQVTLGTLYAQGNLVGQRQIAAGQVSVTAAQGLTVQSIDVSGAGSSTGNGGSGGSIVLTAGGDLQVIGGLNLAGGSAWSSGQGGAGGNLSALSTGGALALNGVQAWGGDGLAGGQGGTAQVAAATDLRAAGTLNLSGGTASSAAAGGAGGTLGIQAGGLVTAGALQANAGDSASGAAGAGGQVTVRGVGGLTLDTAEAVRSGAGAGLVSLSSASGGVTVTQRVQAGSVQIQAADAGIDAGGAWLAATDPGGAVDLSTTGALRFNAISASGGQVRLLAAGDITGKQVSTTVDWGSAAAAAGDVSVRSTGGQVGIDQLSLQGGTRDGRAQAAGHANVQAAQSIRLRSVYAFGSLADSGQSSAGGSVTLTAGGDVTVTDQILAMGGQGGTLGAAGAGGAIQITAGGTVTAGSLQAMGGYAASGAGGSGGQIVVSGDAGLSLGPVDAGISSASMVRGAGGVVSLASSAGSIALSGANAGTVRVRASGDITGSGSWNSFSSQDPQGLVDVAAGGRLQFSSIDSNGGQVLLKAGGDVTGGPIDVRLRAGAGASAGSISVSSTGGSVRLGQLVADGFELPGGAVGGGTVQVTAARDLSLSGVSAAGAGSEAGDGAKGGAIVLKAGGDVSVTGTLDVGGGTSAQGLAGAAGTLGVQSDTGAIRLGDVRATGGSGGLVSISASGGAVSLSGGVSGGSLRILAAGDLLASGQTLSASDADGTLEVTAGGALSFGAVRTLGGAATVQGALGVTGDSVSTTSSAATGSSAGAISVSSASGSVSIRALDASAASTAAGAALPGRITVTAANAIHLGQANADGLWDTGATPGGAIALTAGAGGIQVDGTLSAVGGLLSDGGRVTLSAAGPVQVAAILVDAGPAVSNAGRSEVPPPPVVVDGSAAAGHGGVVTVVSTGAVQIQTIQASGGSAADAGVHGGSGGQVSISGQAVHVGRISAWGGDGGDSAFGGAGGSVSLTASAGSITADTISAGGGYGGNTGGTGGSIALSATGGAITVSGLTVEDGESGGSGFTGLLTEKALFSAVAVSTTPSPTSTPAPTTAPGQVTLRATAVNGVGGDIHVTSFINVTGATQGGSVDIQGDGLVTVAGVDARSLNVPDNGGSVRIAGGQGVTFGALDVGVSGSGTVSLSSNQGSLVQGAGTSINAPQLSLAAAGSADLSQNTNQVRNLTANIGGDLSLLNAGALTLTGTGVQAANVSLNLQGAGANLDQAAGSSLTAGSLAVVASAVNLDNVTLGSAGSPGVLTVQASSGDVLVNNVGTAALQVGTIGTSSGVTATGDPATAGSGRVVLQTAGPLEILAPITSDAPAGSNAIVLVASSVHMGPGGSLNALNDRWAFFLDDPATSDFGNMPVSGNLAVWGRNFDGNLGTSLPETGNRYVFKAQPQVTISLPTPLSKTYDGNASFTGVPTPTLSGIPQAADYGNVFLQDLITVTLDTQVASKNVGTYALGATVLPLPSGYRNTVNLAQATIDKATLTASIVGTPTRAYNGTLDATLTAANFRLDGFVSGEGASVVKTTGSYDSKDVPTASRVSTSLAASDFTADTGTLLGNYALPTTASGAGAITKATLTASIIGAPTKVYEGNTAATLAGANFKLSGLVGAESAGVTQTSGTYNSKDVVSATTVTAALAASDFTAGAATLLDNYTLPTTASGAGAITRATLGASIIGTPTKAYDGGANATLVAGNFALSGFVKGESATVTQTRGVYDAKDVAKASQVSASLSAADFAADGATLLSNYTLPTTASGGGSITRATLTASITGTPTKVYDGTTNATLASTNYKLSGFASGEDATVGRTSGAYNSKDVVTAGTVSTSLSVADFTAKPGTLLDNYTLPTTASGAGAITRATLTAGIVNTPTKVYDGTTAATLSNANFSLGGFVTGESANVTQTVGAYNSKDVVTASTVTASLGAGDFTANGTTLLSNYTLPTTASGAGAISKAPLTAGIVNTPSKVYDGTAAATLTNANFSLGGFVAGESATVTQTVGAYNSKDVVTASTVTAGLAASDFTANGTTLLSNYTLPTTASGAGAITKATLTAGIVNTPSKVYDGTTAATLTNANFSLGGFVTGESANVTQTVGAYNSKDVVTASTVTAGLAASDFTANGTTLLSNYTLPTTASGAGTITPATVTASIVGGPAKTYDGTANALLTAANFDLRGFVTGESATVGKSSGTYNSKDVATASTVTTSLAAVDFTGNGNTLLSNYVLPVQASGAGSIARATLLAAIAGTPTKVYDGTTAAILQPANVALSGFAPNEGASVTASNGVYDSKDVARAGTVTTTLVAGDFAPTPGTLLANYLLPTRASGAGKITPAPLKVAALDQNKQAGEVLALTGQEIQVTGLKGTETVTSAVLSSTGTTADAATGAYVIAAKGPLAGGNGFQADNYLVTYLPGVLTVSAVPSAVQQVSNQVTTLNKLIVEESKAQEDGTSPAVKKRNGNPDIVQTGTACAPAK